jgi:hypothetical protein
MAGAATARNVSSLVGVAPHPLISPFLLDPTDFQTARRAQPTSTLQNGCPPVTHEPGTTQAKA